MKRRSKIKKEVKEELKAISIILLTIIILISAFKIISNITNNAVNTCIENGGNNCEDLRRF